MPQRIINIPAGEDQLHGIVRGPSVGEADALVILCDPFAEEKKCAHRPLTQLARGISNDGCQVLRFDYHGCGDSPGEFVDYGVSAWMSDIEDVIAFATTELNPEWTCLGGLRLGATMAYLTIAQNADVDALLAMQPIIDGRQYVRQNLRRSLIKAMLTRGDDFEAEAVKNRHTSEVIDFDGYQLNSDTTDELKQMDLLSAQVAFDGPALFVSIGSGAEPSEELVQLADASPDARVTSIKLEPFWNRIGLVDTHDLTIAVSRWLSEARGA